MLAIAFDLVVAELQRRHPRSIPAAYAEIGRVLARHGSEWRQGSLYLGGDDDLTKFYLVVQDLQALPWFPPSVRDIRAFRVEQWSDFTGVFKR